MKELFFGNCDPPVPLGGMISRAFPVVPPPSLAVWQLTKRQLSMNRIWIEEAVASADREKLQLMNRFLAMSREPTAGSLTVPPMLIPWATVPDAPCTLMFAQMVWLPPFTTPVMPPL